jgi:hypothetical protein
MDRLAAANSIRNMGISQPDCAPRHRVKILHPHSYYVSSNSV